MASRWIVAPSTAGEAERLAQLLGVRPLTAQLLINRGVADPARARQFLEPRLAELRRPDGVGEMAGFGRAVERLAQALLQRQTIGVFGDYDVDGVSSCALLATFLRDAGGRVVARVARREDGYGFGVGDVQRFAEAGCAVVVTCDCGTSDHEALAAARTRRLDVIVVDHHQVPERDPEAHALINPHQASCRFPFKGLASVGVAFYLAAALRTRLRGAGWPRLPDPRTLTDLVALGTIADLAPLTDENRILVRSGLERLRSAPRPGLQALAEIAGLQDGVQRSADVGLKLAPRLNAPGRLGDAQPALDLLLAEDLESAQARALICETANLRRRELQGEVLREAEQQAAEQPEGVLVVAGIGWSPGVVGIVAAKLVDRYARPAVAIALEGAGATALGRGSARTAGGFHLHQGLREVSDLLVRYGGHAAAAGLTIEAGKLGELRARLSAAARASLVADGRPGELSVDAEVPLQEIDDILAEELRRLEPFGIGNPEPLLAARGVTVERTRIVGQGHLQVTLRDGLHARDGIAFGLADQDPGSGARVHAAFVPEVDVFRGVRRLRMRVRELWGDGEA
jgi:single-stranded-DNA-specific exonuclease